MSTRQMLREGQGPYRKLLSYLKPYRWRFFLGMLTGALYGAVNGLLIFTIKHVSALVFPGGQSANATTLLKAHDTAPAVPLETVVWACAAVPLIMMVRGLFSYLNAYYMLWVSMRVLDDIRTQLFGHMLSQSLEFYNKSKVGDLIQTVFNQTRMAQQALTTISSDVIKQPISILSALGALFFLDWKFTLVALVLFPFCIVPVMIVGRKVRKSGAKEEEEAGQIMVVMHEAFAGIRVVQSLGREDYERKRFDEANEKMLRFIMRWRKAMELVGPLVETFASVGVGFALLYAWYFKLGAGNFLALQGGLILLYPPFKSLSRIHIMMQKCLAATTKVFELMDRKPSIVNAPDAVSLDPVRGAIRFEGVRFAYGPDKAAISKLSLDIPAGKTYALVGASGAGKSTILSLLLRFYEPQAGRILLDGIDIRQITLQSLRAAMGVVSQDTFLFHDTIYNNIRYGRLEATREEIEQAAQQAFAHDFIMEKPDGYETIVGDKGSLLSGGQQQRISIARAFLRSAPILLLDEATSALDSDSEQKIKVALDTLAEGKTVIAIAHRLSTVLNADQIVVMDGGTITDIGTHSELLDRSTQYRRLYEHQFHHEPTEALLV